MVKNTLFSIAAGEELASKLEALLAGPTAIVFAGDDPVAPAKALKTFGDANKPVDIKAAYIDGQIVDAKARREAGRASPEDRASLSAGRLAQEPALRSR